MIVLDASAALDLLMRGDAAPMIAARVFRRGESVNAPHLIHRVWSLRGTLTAYDATYVALAETLDAVLVTMDGKIARAPGHGARVEVVG